MQQQNRKPKSQVQSSQSACSEGQCLRVNQVYSVSLIKAKSDCSLEEATEYQPNDFGHLK
jgi:hypothetical protein